MWPLSEKSDFLSLDIVADAEGAAVCFEKSIQKELFYQDPDDIAIKVCTVADGKPLLEESLKSEDELCTFLAAPRPEVRTSRAYIIGQESSRSPLDVTASAFRALLASINAFPAVTKVVDAFNSDPGSDLYIGTAGIHFSPAHVHKDTKVLETCCLLKYVEPREKGEGVFGFSIRQMGFYHNVNLATQLETTILMSPSVELWTRLKIHLTDSSSSAKSRKHWSHTPLLAFTSLAAGWTGYVGALHAAVAQIMNDAAFYRPEGSLKVVDTETLKRSAVVKGRLQHASHVLQNNIETLRAALDEYRRRKAQLQDHGDTEYQAFQQGVQDTMRELHFIQNQIQLIAQRLDQTCASSRDVATIENSNFMGQMTARSIVEAQAVRIIALITFLLLPPTFTAGFLEMGFIHDVRYQNGTLSLQADAGLLLWLTITLPLMALTVGIWFFWDFRTKRNLREKQDYIV